MERNSGINLSQWEIDTAHTTAQFSVRHMMVAKVRGHFEKVSGTVNLDEDDLTRSLIDVVLDASTINTRNEQRDGHLRSPDFFDVAQHPTITFRSTRVERAGGDRLEVTGDLTMRGVTRPITLAVEGPTPPARNPYGKQVRGVSATGRINRKEWGLSWNAALEAGGVLVGDEVEIQNRCRAGGAGSVNRSRGRLASGPGTPAGVFEDGESAFGPQLVADQVEVVVVGHGKAVGGDDGGSGNISLGDPQLLARHHGVGCVWAETPGGSHLPVAHEERDVGIFQVGAHVGGQALVTFMGGGQLGCIEHGLHQHEHAQNAAEGNQPLQLPGRTHHDLVEQATAPETAAAAPP